LAWAVKAPANPMPFAPCSNRAKPAAWAGGGVRVRAQADNASAAAPWRPRERMMVIEGILLVSPGAERPESCLAQRIATALDGGGRHHPAQGHGVPRLPLSKPLEGGQVGPEHVALVHRRQ